MICCFQMSTVCRPSNFVIQIFEISKYQPTIHKACLLAVSFKIFQCHFRTFQNCLYVMGTKSNREFKHALMDVVEHAPLLQTPYGNNFYLLIRKLRGNFLDRVRCSEWCRKLASVSDDTLDSSQIKNEYMQFLRIQVRNHFLHGPFKCPPPEQNDLSPLAECLGNMMAQQVLLQILLK